MAWTWYPSEKSGVVSNEFVQHAVGSVFQPIFHIVGWLLALCYDLIPNYAVAIAMLTVIIMAVLTPFTIKSTKSMMAMQKLQPEIKKLQQKYKGPENRQQLNEEMMKLYREEGANPIGGCLPMLLQMPFLFILYQRYQGASQSGAEARQVGVPSPLHTHNLKDVQEPYCLSRADQGVWHGLEP